MGAATLLIHILANVATDINTSRTTLGFEPAAFKIRVAVMTSSRVFESTAAIVKPPIRSIMVGENIWEKMYLVASAALSLSSSPSDERRTRRVTVKKGTARDVTNKGIALSGTLACQLSNAQADLLRLPKELYRIQAWPCNCFLPLCRGAASVLSRSKTRSPE